MFESRCGVDCSQCERKTDVSCRGCIYMDKPFWGSPCGVKSCCEEKGLNHCGQCREFPCEMLATMGVDQGFDPKPKLENCKAWAKLKLRQASMEDLEAVVSVEAECFPQAEAAGKEAFAERLRVFGDHFWLLEDEGTLVGFINGMVTSEETIDDLMYEKADLHNENGAWQTVFGVDTIPQYRHKGCAALLLQRLITDAKQQGRKGCILTCKKELVHYYEKFGFKNWGQSQSVHGGALWYDMRLEF